MKTMKSYRFHEGTIRSLERMANAANMSETELLEHLIRKCCGEWIVIKEMEKLPSMPDTYFNMIVRYKSEFGNIDFDKM